jgi:DNA-3-methyladenine glycosylase II
MIESPCIVNQANFHFLCDKLSKKDKYLHSIIRRYGYPTFWMRKPNFETLVHIILEQQVSLASAKAALNRLKEKTGNIQPGNILLLSDAELKACYFSRQKIVYVRHLAQSIISNQLQLRKLRTASNETVITELKKIKGIGDWTASIFLMIALQRCDLFPIGDIALLKSIKDEMNLPNQTTKDDILQLSENWRPYRTVAAYILWHAYLKKRNIKI